MSPSSEAGIGRRPAVEDREEGRWRAMLRHGLPAAGVLGVMTLVAGIAWYVHTANRGGAAALGNDLVAAIEARVSGEMHAYLEPPQRILELVDVALNGRPFIEARREAEGFAGHALATIGWVGGVSFSDPEGSFLYVMRNAAGSFDTKLVDRRNGGHRVEWTRRNSAGKVIAVEDDP